MEVQSEKTKVLLLVSFNDSILCVMKELNITGNWFLLSINGSKIKVLPFQQLQETISNEDSFDWNMRKQVFFFSSNYGWYLTRDRPVTILLEIDRKCK